MPDRKPRRRPKRSRSCSAMAQAAREEAERRTLIERCERLNRFMLYCLVVFLIVFRFIPDRLGDKTSALILAVTMLPAAAIHGYMAWAYLKLPKKDRESLRRPYFRTPVTEFVTALLLEGFVWYMWFNM